MPEIGGWQAIPGMWKSQSGRLRGKTNPWSKRGFGVDPTRGRLVPLKANFRTQPSIGWVIYHDADVQPPESQAEEQAWFSGPYADERGPEDPQPAPSEGSAAFGGERRLEIGTVRLARPNAGAPGRFRLPPASRITRTRDIRKLLRKGKRKKTPHLDVFFLSSEGSSPRFGLVVPKHRHQVVDRNKVKRRLREIVRKEVLPRLRDEGVNGDLLIRARREAYATNYQRLLEELKEITEELCSGPSSWR